MKTRTTLYADENMILTDGEHFGKIVHLEIGADASVWHEITMEEYAALSEQESNEV
mgnify:CR=1 FL=1